MDSFISPRTETSKLMIDAGILPLTSCISPFQHQREPARKIVGPNNFFEVHLNASIKACEERDPKGLYKKARAGDILNFTGIDSPYEEPENPDIVIDSVKMTIKQVAHHLIHKLNAFGVAL